MPVAIKETVPTCAKCTNSIRFFMHPNFPQGLCTKGPLQLSDISLDKTPAENALAMGKPDVANQILNGELQCLELKNK